MNVISSETTNKREKKLERQSSKRKVHISERDDFLKTYSKLKQQEEFIEKAVNCFISSMKTGIGEITIIMRDQLKLSIERDKSLDILKRTTWGISNELKSAKSLINDPLSLQQIDIGNYKETLLKLSHKIQEHKKLCSIQALEEEQSKLEAELTEFESTLNKNKLVRERNPSMTKGSLSKANGEHSCHDYRGVEDFTCLVAKSGHSQGWSEEDHLSFLRMRKKCSTIPALVTAMRNKCPDLTAENIVNHEAWYKVYLDLRDKQKDAIKEWRKQKESDRRKDKELEEIEVKDQTEMIPLVNDVEEILVKKREESSNETLKSTTRVSKEGRRKERKKELVRQWREEQERKCLMENEQKKNIELNKMTEEKRRKSRHERIKTLVLEHKERKLKEMADFKADTSAQDVSRKLSKYDSIRMIKLFRQQDEEYMEKRRARMKENRDRSNKIVPQKTLAPRERSTLLDPTKVWEMKCKSEPRAEKGFQEALYIKYIPKLASTQWRNQETL